MKKLTKEISEKSIDPLKTEEKSLRADIARMVLEAKSNPQKDSNALTKKRRRLAVVLTIAAEKVMAQKLAGAKK